MNLDGIADKLLTTEGVFNIRDIGGYQNTEGSTLQGGRYIRSGHLGHITPNGISVLSAAGVDCVIDLRSSSEVEQNPDIFKSSNYHHIPMMDGVQSNLSQGITDAFPTSMAALYIMLLAHSGAQIKKVFDVLASPDYRTIVFHCTAGKDRTGITAMLLLALAQVDAQTIVQDYAYSEHLIKLDQMHLNIAELPRYLFESQPESMQATLSHLDTVYGGADQYLTSIGVTTAQKQVILSKLLG